MSSGYKEIELEEFLTQKLNLGELVTFKILKNYQKIALTGIVCLIACYSNQAFLKSAALIGLLICSSLLLYVHLRFGNLVFAMITLLILLLSLDYLFYLI